MNAKEIGGMQAEIRRRNVPDRCGTLGRLQMPSLGLKVV
jgi:hypothetical protein